MKPFISFVATSRNDDHGGDVLRRTQSFVNGLAAQAQRHATPIELVLVDWNPPRARPPLADVLCWPAGGAYFTARVITFPHSLHATLKHGDKLAMFQMIAKNVGIRRAKGRFICTTNIDIIFSDELFEACQPYNLKEGVLYRSDRWDIPNAVQLESNFDRLLARARSEAFRKNLADGTWVKKGDTFVNSTPDRMDAWVFQRIEGKVQQALDQLHTGRVNEAITALGEINTKLLPEIRENLLIPQLHTNGCGDFTMMSRADWFAMRGYPEWRIFSWAIDSVLVYQAYYNGLEIHQFPEKATHYHIEHDYGSGWTPEGASTLWTRMTQRGVPFLTYEGTMEIFQELRRCRDQNQYLVYCGLDWGFAQATLPETVTVTIGSPAQRARKTNDGPLKEHFDASSLPKLSCALEHFYKPVDQVKQSIVAKSREKALRVESAAIPWSYATAYDLRPDLALGGEWRVALRLLVQSGEISVGILNSDQTAFISSTPPLKASDKWVEEFFFIKDGGDVSSLVIRNHSGATVSVFEVGSLTLHWLRTKTGEAPDQRALDARKHEIKLGHEVPPAAPVTSASLKERIYLPVSLAGYWKGVDSANIVPSGGKLRVTTPEGVGAYGVGVDTGRLVSKRPLAARVSLYCDAGVVSVALLNRKEDRVIAESAPIAAGDTQLVMIEGVGFDAVVVRNQQTVASTFTLSAVEIEAERWNEFAVRIRPSGFYKTSQDARIEGDDQTGVIVTTPAECDAYALGYDLRPIFRSGGGRRVRVSVDVKDGAVAVGILNEYMTDWVAKTNVVKGPARTDFNLEIDDASNASALILRNAQIGQSIVVVREVAVSGPWNEMMLAMPAQPHASPTIRTRVMRRLIATWNSNSMISLRKAAPEPLRRMWRKLYFKRL